MAKFLGPLTVSRLKPAFLQVIDRGRVAFPLLHGLARADAMQVGAQAHGAGNGATLRGRRISGLEADSH